MKNLKLEKLFSQLPEETQRFSNLLLAVSLENIDFDNPYFKYTLKIDHPSLSSNQKELIESILENIPEWQRLVNCKQHPTHDYDLGIHTLLVIKKIQNTSQYNDLDEYSKLILLCSALLHDIEKVEKVVDPEHPQKGAETASLILDRLSFEKNFINDVSKLIKNHQLLGLIAANRLNIETSKLAEIFKKVEIVNLQAILAVADIKSVKKNEAFFSEQIGKNIEKIRFNTNIYIQKF